MGRDELARIHSDRAIEELEVSFAAPSLAAAIAHLKLSSLHMKKAMQHQRPDQDLPDRHA
jgi:hypothetical protein